MALGVVAHDHPRRVARQTPGRFRGNVDAVLNHRLAGGARVCQDGGIDVDDDVIALARSAGIDAAMEGRLGDERQGVGLLLIQRGMVLADDPPRQRERRSTGEKERRPVVQRRSCSH